MELQSKQLYYILDFISFMNNKERKINKNSWQPKNLKAMIGYHDMKKFDLQPERWEWFVMRYCCQVAGNGNGSPWEHKVLGGWLDSLRI